ncbi:MAG: sugar O-acetyltransferase [Eggerthellaceae bacterium]|nr:sugar O-acetyltransferase [Eggerthellaceae bacterium]
MNEHQRQMAGRLYNPYKTAGDWQKIRMLLKRFNDSEYWHDSKPLDELKAMFGEAHDDTILTPPFHCDHGFNIRFGEAFYANTGLTILDENEVVFGDRVIIAPHVSVFTAGHPIDAEVRATGLEYAKPVRIGSDVWIGGNVVINPGVTIGDDVVIGSGSVVTKDIPPHSLAAGNPCKVIRTITREEREYWRGEYGSYAADC